jgi:hypothetical protein
MIKLREAFEAAEKAHRLAYFVSVTWCNHCHRSLANVKNQGHKYQLPLEMFGTPEQRAAEEQRRAKKLEQFRPTWKKVTFALFERAEIPVTYRGPKDKWRGFSKSLLYSFTPKWVPNPNATGRYNLVIEGRESYASETVFEYSPNMIDKNHKETSLGQCFLLELSVHSSINNDNSLSEKAQSKQQK